MGKPTLYNFFIKIKMNQESGNKFGEFMQLHRNMLDCYAQKGMAPAQYKHLDAAEQHAFCRSERMRLEDSLIKQKIRPQDFFKAAQAQ